MARERVRGGFGGRSRQTAGGSGSGTRRARVQDRVPLPVRSCPTGAHGAPVRSGVAIGRSPYSAGVRWNEVESGAVAGDEPDAPPSLPAPTALPNEPVSEPGERRPVGWPVAPECHHPEASHRGRIEEAHQRGAHRQVVLEGRGGIGLDRL